MVVQYVQSPCRCTGQWHGPVHWPIGWVADRPEASKHCLLFNMWCAGDDRLSSCCGPCLCTGRPLVYAQGNCPARMANTICMWSRAIRQAVVLLPTVCGCGMQPVVVVSTVGVVLWVAVVVAAAAAAAAVIGPRVAGACWLMIVFVLVVCGRLWLRFRW